MREKQSNQAHPPAEISLFPKTVGSGIYISSLGSNSTLTLIMVPNRSASL